ncbi:MAG: hypothetical protein ACK56F_22150, partial [bacterium]
CSAACHPPRASSQRCIADLLSVSIYSKSKFMKIAHHQLPPCSGARARGPRGILAALSPLARRWRRCRAWRGFCRLRH